MHLLQDLDLAEIRQLRARQRLFARDQSCAPLVTEPSTCCAVQL
jgi:hypothetical protein